MSFHGFSGSLKDEKRKKIARPTRREGCEKKKKKSGVEKSDDYSQ
jgi:hypothetical protein